ncbi:MAG: efflux RND transporter periplasmic adaptor subunit [Spirochaetaceae bacterium]|jgi:multidrug efflux pump subunit AcrA (membrane-fusion protein)|nr:efflux RND transporter periplasmic adaptor subunit [Spirochaetaceae bacterium]
MKTETKNRRRLLILLVIIIAVVLCAVSLLFASGKFGRFNLRAQSNTTYRVRSESFAHTIEIAGNISAAKEQKLQVAGTGTVSAVYVHEGDTVHAGQPILQLDDTEQRYNLAKHDFDMQQRRVSGSPRELSLMAIQRNALVQRVKDRQIIANFDGVIAEFSAAAGDVYEAKDAVGMIIDRNFLTATVEVVESDAPKLRVGQKVTMKFPAAGNESYEGRVDSFPAVAVKSSRGASVVKAVLRLDNPPDIILPNYSFTGEIEISQPETFLVVERAAIKFEIIEDKERKQTQEERPQQARRKTFAERILADGTIERVEVQVRPYGMEFVRIIDGLNEGDELKIQESPRVSGERSNQPQNMQFRQGQGQNQQGGTMGSPGGNRRQQQSPQVMIFR